LVTEDVVLEGGVGGCVRERVKFEHFLDPSFRVEWGVGWGEELREARELVFRVRETWIELTI